MKMNPQEILERLPHRYPFLLIDKVLDCDSETFITVQKNVTFNEPQFQGHFPEHPVFPGVLVLEAMAQATGLLSFEVIDGLVKEDSVFMLVGVDDARIKQQIVPGDILIIRAEVLRRSRNVMKFNVTAKVDEKLVASAVIMGAYADKG